MIVYFLFGLYRFIFKKYYKDYLLCLDLMFYLFGYFVYEKEGIWKELCSVVLVFCVFIVV